MLTQSQLQTLKADILADPALSSQPNNSDGNLAIAAAYNLAVEPDLWVWRTSVSRSDIYNEPSPTGSTWNWTTYKNQSATEQNAWVQMFMGDQANFAKANLRAGVAALQQATLDEADALAVALEAHRVASDSNYAALVALASELGLQLS